MKRKSLIILITLLLIVCGCNKSSEKIDIPKASAVLDEKFTNMESMDEMELSVVYGIDVSLFDEYVIKSSKESNGNLYAIIKVTDANKQSVESQIDGMFATLESQSNLYSPDAVKLIKNRLSTKIGNYLIYIVSDDNQSYYDSIKEFIE